VGMGFDELDERAVRVGGARVPIVGMAWLERGVMSRTKWSQALEPERNCDDEIHVALAIIVQAIPVKHHHFARAPMATRP
jgi:hypothetical protein